MMNKEDKALTKKLLALFLTAILMIPLFTIAVTANNGGADIVFAIDTGKSMRQFDYDEDGVLAEALVGVIEQAPSGSAFGVAAKDGITPLTDSDAAGGALYALPSYSGDCDVSQLLQSAAGMLSGSDKEKIIVLSTPQWYNITYEANALKAQGITVYIIAFEQDIDAGEELKSEYPTAFVCASVQEVSYRIADLYAYVVSLPPYSSGITLFAVTFPPYTSSFRLSKHGFGYNVNGGGLLSVLFNMYYLMPANVIDRYTLTGVQGYHAARGDMVQLFSGGVPNGFTSFWESKTESLLASGAYSISSNGGITGKVQEAVYENLSRRIPVLINNGGKNYLLTKLSGMGTYTAYDPATNTETSKSFSGTVKIIDTMKYFDDIYKKPPISNEVIENNERLKMILPESYNDARRTVWKYSEESGLETYGVNSDRSVNISFSKGTSFTISIGVSFEGDLPNLFGAVKNFRILLFEDVPRNHWAWEFIFGAANNKIINGYEDNEIFIPEGSTTVAEYLSMLLRAADVEGYSTAWDLPKSVSNPTGWPVNYLLYADSKGLWPTGYVYKGYDSFADMNRMDNALSTEGYQHTITREFAFALAWSVLTGAYCRTANWLEQYEPSNSAFTDTWKITHSDFETYIMQLVANGVVAGRTENEIEPTAEIKRSEIATLLLKCITQKGWSPVSADDRMSSLLADSLKQSPISLNTLYSGNLSGGGGAAYHFAVSSTGLYKLEHSGTNVDLAVYEEKNGQFYRVIKNDSFTGGSFFGLVAGRNVIIALYGGASQQYTVKVSLQAGCLDINYSTSITANTAAKDVAYYLGDVPKNKIMVVSFQPANGSDNASAYVNGISLSGVANGNVPHTGFTSPKTSMAYFSIVSGDSYILTVSNIVSAPAKAYTIHVYTVDRLAEERALSKYHSLEDESETTDNYLIFNSPEHISAMEHLGEGNRYISRMPVNGKANIYWEHYNDLNPSQEMKYGILLYNTTGAAVTVTVNRESSYEHSANFRGLTKIWEDYFTQKNSGYARTVTIQNNQAQWVHVETVQAAIGTIFNGIVNVTVPDNKTLNCYAFALKSTAAADAVKWDFDNGYSWMYLRADGSEGGITGSGEGPVLVSDLDTVDLSGGKEYRLLLTGEDAPLMNEGEAIPLYYNGAPAMNHEENSLNYSVIYKFHISGFNTDKSKVRVWFEYNDYTNPGKLAEIGSGIHLAYVINGDFKQTALLNSDLEFLPVKDEDDFDSDVPMILYVICSGMSTLPVTVRFESYNP